MKKKILVVEDDPMIRKMMTFVLNEYDVSLATDGALGVKKAKEEKPDLILLDMSLPILDGYETFTELKKLPETINIPVIALTARKITPGELEEYGFKYYLQKPFDPMELTRMIDNLFSKKDDNIEKG